MKELEQIIDRLDPDAALDLLAEAVRGRFSRASEASQKAFVHALTGEAQMAGDQDLVHY